MEAWVSDGGITYDVYKTSAGTNGRRTERSGHVFRMLFAAPSSSTTGTVRVHDADKQLSYNNYIIGSDASKWRTRVAKYNKVTLSNVYKGIDALLVHENNNLRYDMLVAAGANPREIVITFEGVESIRIREDGQLELQTSIGSVLQRQPIATQLGKPVPCRFEQRGKHAVGFVVGAYDVSKPLVIDPLTYSTFVGGVGDCFGGSLAVDDKGCAYVSGIVYSTEYPITTGAYRDTIGGATDYVISKLNPAGTQLVFSTFVGGSGDEILVGSSDVGRLAVDKEYCVYMSGSTTSSDYPTTAGSYSRTLRGPEDGCLTKLNADGTGLVYSTLIGSQGVDSRFVVEVDTAGSAYVVGEVSGTGYPTTAGAYMTSKAGPTNFVVTKFNKAGTALIYSTFLGGSNITIYPSLVIDKKGAAYITGYTRSSDFPISSKAFRKEHNGDYDCFITKLSFNGSAIEFSTFVGEDWLPLASNGLDIDDDGNSYLARNVMTGGGSICVSKLNADGTKQLYIKVFGGTLADNVFDLVVDDAGCAYVTGMTNSADFPVTFDAFSAWQNANSDAYLTKISADGKDIEYSTYIGGTGLDQAFSLARDEVSGVYMAGSTGQGNYPTSPYAFQTVHNGNTDLFVSKFRMCGMLASAGADTSVCQNTPIHIGKDAKGGLPPFTYVWTPAIGLNSTTIASPIARPSVTTQYIVTATDALGCLDRDTVVITVLERPVAKAGNDVQICPGQSATIGSIATGGVPPYTYLWSPSIGLSAIDASTPKAQPTSTRTYVVVVTDDRGCSSSDTVVVTVASMAQTTLGVTGSLEFCDGDSVKLDAGGTYASYRWSSLETTRDIVVKKPGTYWLQFTDVGGCPGRSDTVTVSVLPKPNVAIRGAKTICVSSDVMYSVSAQPGASYRWTLVSPTGDTVTFTDTNAIHVSMNDVGSAKLHIQVRAANGCMDSSSITISVGNGLKPVIIGDRGFALCESQQVVLDAGAGFTTYLWSNGATTPTITVATAGRYAVTVSDGTGCSGTSDSIDITITPIPTPEINGAPSLEICRGLSTVLSTTTAYRRYKWSTGDTTRAISVTTPGVYSVEVTDGDSCSASTSVNVTEGTGLKPSITPTGISKVCRGDSVMLGVDGEFATYVWSTQENTPTIWVRSTGAYWVTVSNGGGCEGTSDTVDIAAVAPGAPPTVTRKGDTLISSAAESYQWMLDDAVIPNATTQSFVVQEVGVYKVLTTDTNGCVLESNQITNEPNRLVWLDTVSGHVGHRLRLTMKVDPPLRLDELIDGFRVYLHLDPSALFVHGAADVAGTGGTQLVLHTAQFPGTGMISVERPTHTTDLQGDVVMYLDLEGLVTAQPLNVVRVDSVVFLHVKTAGLEDESVAVAGNGLVLLSGCEIARAFGLRASIQNVQPNPITEDAKVTYYAPPGARPKMRLVDMRGQSLQSFSLQTAIGDELIDIDLPLSEIPAGVYILQLLNGAEVSSVPITIAK